MEKVVESSIEAYLKKDQAAKAFQHLRRYLQKADERSCNAIADLLKKKLTSDSSSAAVKRKAIELLRGASQSLNIAFVRAVSSNLLPRLRRILRKVLQQPQNQEMARLILLTLQDWFLLFADCKNTGYFEAYARLANKGTRFPPAEIDPSFPYIRLLLRLKQALFDRRYKKAARAFKAIEEIMPALEESIRGCADPLTAAKLIAVFERLQGGMTEYVLLSSDMHECLEPTPKDLVAESRHNRSMDPDCAGESFEWVQESHDLDWNEGELKWEFCRLKDLLCGKDEQIENLTLSVIENHSKCEVLQGQLQELKAQFQELTSNLSAADDKLKRQTGENRKLLSRLEKVKVTKRSLKSNRKSLQDLLSTELLRASIARARTLEIAYLEQTVSLAQLTPHKPLTVCPTTEDIRIEPWIVQEAVPISNNQQWALNCLQESNVIYEDANLRIGFKMVLADGFFASMYIGNKQATSIKRLKTKFLKQFRNIATWISVEEDCQVIEPHKSASRTLAFKVVSPDVQVPVLNVRYDINEVNILLPVCLPLFLTPGRLLIPQHELCFSLGNLCSCNCSIKALQRRLNFFQRFEEVWLDDNEAALQSLEVCIRMRLQSGECLFTLKSVDEKYNLAMCGLIQRTITNMVI